MARRPKTSTEASMAAQKRDFKLQRLEEKLARGWAPPPPKPAAPRPPDQLEEVTPDGIQLTIFAAIAASDGNIRAKELQRFHAGDAHTPRRRSRSTDKTRTKSETARPQGDSEEEAANKAWLAASFG